MEGRLHISQKSSIFVPELAKGHFTGSLQARGRSGVFVCARSRKHLYVYYD